MPSHPLPDTMGSPLPQPVVSVGIPTYNRCESLAKVLTTVLAQEGPFRLEVVVSDNASADGTQAYLRKTMAEDPRLRVIFQEENQGPFENFRVVLREAGGDYFMWLPDDDWLSPGYIAACLSALEADAGLALVGGTAWFHPDPAKGEPWQTPPCHLPQSSPRARLREYFAGVRDNSILFGIMRARDARRLVLPHGVAADWMVVGQLACVGRVTTLHDAQVHRSAAGASSSLEATAEYFGLAGRRARNPWGLVSRRIVSVIGRGVGLYSELPLSTRVVTALSCGWVVFRLHYLTWAYRAVVLRVLGAGPLQWLWRRLRPWVKGKG
ncbi:MAG: glycosyltransferase family 2 protein [Gemmatimonadota bacterium]